MQLGGRCVMGTIILICLGIISVGVLYSCVALSTTYDKKIDAMEQENFLRNYKRRDHKLP